MSDLRICILAIVSHNRNQTINIHTTLHPSLSIYSTQACFTVSYQDGKCILTRDRLQAFHFDQDGMVLLFQPGFVSGQYRDSYFCTWNLPDPKPQHRYGLYLLQKDFHGASGGLDQCYCHDHMTVETHGELPSTFVEGTLTHKTTNGASWAPLSVYTPLVLSITVS